MTAELRQAGRGLETGHPGTIHAIIPMHLQVQWLGLEEEPESWGVGYDEIDGIYPTLHAATPGEWDYATRTGWWHSPEPH